MTFTRGAKFSVSFASALLLALVVSPGPASAATLDTITVTPADATMRAGFTQAYIATGHYSDGTTANVSQTASWSTANTGVATVTNQPGLKGLVTAVGPGTTRVAAQISDGLRIIRGSTQIVVTEGDLVSITTKPTSKNLEVGQQTQFKATALFVDDSDDDITAEAEWSSSNPAIASVSNVAPTKGLVTAHKVGNVVITVRDTASGVQNSDGAAIVRAQVSHLSFDPPTVVLGRNIKYPIRVYANRVDKTRSNITEDVEFSVVPGGVVRVGTGDNAGILTPLENGAAFLSAFDPKRGISTADSGNDATVEVRGRMVELHVEPNPTRMTIGEDKNAKAFGLLSSGLKTSDLRRIVQWSTTDPSVATVGNTVNDVGELVGKKNGVTTLRASYPAAGLTSPETDNLQVLGVLQSVNLEVGDALFPMNEEFEVKARGTYEGGVELNISDKCTWSVVNPSIATVDNADSATDGDGKGGVTGVQLGTTSVKAVCEGKQNSKAIRVIGTLTGMSVDPEADDAEALEEIQFEAIGSYSDGSSKFLTKLAEWTSSNTSVATVDNVEDPGTVTAIGTGSSTITATLGALVASGSLTVGAGIVRIEVTPDGNTIRGSMSLRMKAKGIRADGSDPKPLSNLVTWTSANPQIARVSDRPNEKGLVFGGGVEGTTQITATLLDTEFSDSATITTSCLLDSMRFQPATRSWPVGRAKRAKVLGTYLCGGTPSDRNISANVVYTSSNENVVLVSNQPKAIQVLTAVAPGTATITAFDPSTGKSAVNSLQVTITP